MIDEAFFSAIQGMISPEYPLEELRGTVVARTTLPTLPMMHFLNAVNHAVEWAGPYLTFSNNPLKASLVAVMLPEIVVTALLAANAAKASEVLPFVQTLKHVSTFSYENKKVQVGLIVVADSSLEDIRRDFASRHITFLEISSPKTLSDVLYSTKQAYALVDGRVMAYVVDYRGQLLGLAQKQSDSLEIGQVFFSSDDRQLDQKITQLSLLQSIQNGVMGAVREEFPLESLMGLFVQLASASSKKQELQQSIATYHPHMLFGQVYDGRLTFQLGPRTVLQWQGGQWRVWDGSALESLLATLLVTAETWGRHNVVPIAQLATQLISLDDIMQHFSDTNFADLFLKSITAEMETSSKAHETLSHLSADPMFSDFVMRIGTLYKIPDAIKALDTTTIPHAVPDGLQASVAAFLAGMAVGEAVDTEVPPSFGIDQVLDVADHLCDLVIDLSRCHIGTIIVMTTPENVEQVTTACHAHPFDLHQDFLVAAPDHYHTISQADKYFLRKICGVDGALLVSTQGDIHDFGLILKTFAKGSDAHEGARTAAAKSFSSLDGVVCVLKVSEDGPVTVFGDGNVLLEMT